MLLSRFWIILLSFTATFALAAGTLSRNFIQRELAEEVDAKLKQDRNTIEAALRHEARLRLDDIAVITANPSVGIALKQASQRNPKRYGTLQSSLEGLLKNNNAKFAELKADILFALESHGLVVASAGNTPVQVGDSFRHFPVVTAALSGHVRDSLWVLGGVPYRIAARPVVYHGSYVGVIVHAKSFDRSLAQKLSKLTGGTSVAFFQGTKIIASHEPANNPNATSQHKIVSGITKAIKSKDYEKEWRSAVQSIGDTDKAIYVALVAQALPFDIGYAIARPKPNIASISSLFSAASSDDINNIPFVSLSLLCLFLVAIGMALIWWERDRTLGLLQKAIQSIVRKEHERLKLTDFSGIYRGLAQDVNQALDTVISGTASGRQKPTTLDAILGSSPTPSSSGDFLLSLKMARTLAPTIRP
ncbi:MAG: hypothetical protein IPJ88_06905 [Myxococcales bacterium]|nr:MAG: hypothetical protein IPJ88_06905 [Myxococcales bacterium]